jgi:hypothetical protein
MSEELVNISFTITEDPRAYHSSLDSDTAPKKVPLRGTSGHASVKGKIIEANRP